VKRRQEICPMPDECRERLESLARCLEEALTLLDEDSRQAEAAEKERKASEQGLREQRQAWLARALPFDLADDLMEVSSKAPSDPGRLAARMTAADDRRMRWEAALAEAQDQLMRLWAEPDLRTGVESIAERVRALRRLRAAGPDQGWRVDARERLWKEQQALHEHWPKVRSLPEDVTEEEAAPFMRETMSAVFESLAGMSTDLAQSHQATIAWLTDQRALLEQALTTARELCRRRAS
jgi:hypothetical protein